MNKPKLSIFMITQNEADKIEACLKTAAFADEIVIVDGNSHDRTRDIAKQYTDRIYTQPYEGCGPQKAKAFALTTGDWVMNLDADEQISRPLQAEIRKAIQNPKDYQGFEIPFQTYYCKRAIRFGDWFGEKHLRLFKRDKGKIIPKLIHFGLEVDGKIGRLKHKIAHYSFPDLDKVLEKINFYSTQGAKEKFRTHQKGGLLKALFRSLWTFIRGYIIRFGFLDGKEGFLLAVSNAEGCYYRYLKLMYLYQNRKTHQE